MTRFKLLLLAVLAALSIGAVAHAASFTTAKDNSAYAEASGPGASDFDLAFGLRENKTAIVDESNSATAYGNCDNCRAIAIAFQIVIVQSATQTTVAPQNIALAVNEGCSGCSALAIAHQFVAGKGEPATITAKGRRQLAVVAGDLLRLERTYKQYTNAQIEARANSAAAKIRATLSTELVPVDGRGEPDVDEHRRLDRAA